MQNVIFHLVLTNQCNKRCEYCDLNFSNNYIAEENIDLFIEYINNNSHKYWEIRINFFWWEPLLKFNIIKKILNNIKAKNIKYSIWTNGILLTQDIYKILSNYNVEINYSIDTETYSSLLKQKYIDVTTDNFNINFIINPNTISLSEFVFQSMYDKGVKNINILPIYATINWDKSTLIKFNNFIDIVNKYKNISLYGLSYYERPTSDIEYLLETNWNIYQDIHTHLWFLKQYESIPKNIRDEIEKESYIWTIKDIEENLREIQFCKLQKLYKMSLEIAKNLWFQINFMLIDKILKKLK